MYLKDYKRILNAIDHELMYADVSRSSTNIWGCNNRARIRVPKDVYDYFMEKHKVIKIDDQDKFVISRKDVFDCFPKSDSDIEIITFYLTIFVWGYPNGGRGENLNSILNDEEKIRKQYFYIKEYNSKMTLTNIFEELKQDNLKIKSMGPSTFTKILYFMRFRDGNGVSALIFDKVMQEMINSRRFFEINEKLNKMGIRHLYNSDGISYGDFCKLMDELAKELNTSLFAMEYFLFYICRTI